MRLMLTIRAINLSNVSRESKGDQGFTSITSTPNPIKKKLRNKPMSQELGFAFLGGWLLGVIFTFFKLPLPVPPFQGLVAAAAVLLGQVTYNFIKERFAL